MSKKHKENIKECDTWNELKNFAEDNGFTYSHTTGGHAVYNPPNKNARPVPFSTHEEQPQKGLLCKIRKEILAGLLVATLLFGFFIYCNFCA